MLKTKKVFYLQMLIQLVIFFFSSSITAQDLSDQKKYDAIPVADFYDSSHHWYDINDEERVISPLPGQKKYKLDEITKIADNILLFQKTNGGWAKNYDMLAILTEEQRAAVEKSKEELNTTFDNGATHSQIDYLAKVYFVTKENKYKDACVRGIEFILSAQYPNGGWPQFYPDTSGYRKYITFNDGAMIGIMNFLKKIKDNAKQFSFLDNDLRTKVINAFDNGVSCILKCQIKEEDNLLVWCQQHDNINLLPQNARTFEPASICNGESTGIVTFLMSIENPNKEIINSIQSAVKWFNESKIFGIKEKVVEAKKVDFMYHTTDKDKIVVEDPKAPPIWTRYYELGTHKPMFCNRDGRIVYSLAEVDRERRTGYKWYDYDPQEVLNKYPVWQKKYAPDNNVLK